ncbi:MAG TPA: permease prefix domain 1-containing protein, partial [Gemmatimonadaceae bacterium]|nr:permease prefix domain 1-containing protein [Gemmatimonadaceae bacterium]
MLTELWSELRYRVRALFFRDAIEQELDAELRFHIGCEAEKYERLGVPREEALRRARLVFGGVDRIKEESRDVRGTVLLESLVQDVRYAVRGVRAKPGFAAGVALTLALGIGANSAMFGVFDRLLL